MRRHLSTFLDELLAEFTGLHFHISWAPSKPDAWDARTLPTGCSKCCRLTGSSLLSDCRECGQQQLARTLEADGKGHGFTCRLGVRNYWLPIRIRGETLGLAYLQALAHSLNRPASITPLNCTVSHHLEPPDARVMSQSNFARATRLLQLIIRHAQTATLADLRETDLISTRCVVTALEMEQARRHKALPRQLPPASRTLDLPGPESRPEQVVHRLLEHIEQDYPQPITLRGYARDLGMNAAYLSALFSRAVGVPFKAYLTELRLEKAKALLADPAKTATDVAYAVGYASESRFRTVFRKATGLCPRLWRETMRVVLPS